MIPIYKPYLKKYKKDALDAIESEWISNYGIYVDIASKKLRELIGVNYCILMNNGTSATHCLFLALKYKYPHIKKIYVPNYTFIAPINCALMEYSVDTIEVVKTDKDTMNMDISEDTLMKMEPDSALVVVHNLGNIVNVNKIHKFRPDIIIIEDNCEGLFGKYEGKYTGSSPATLCSAVSFYANKTITTGEGGAFFTNDIDVYKHIKHVYSHGMDAKRYIHSVIGYNYRMTNIQAALLNAQLNDIEHILSLKQTVVSLYESCLKSLITANKIKMLNTDENTNKSNWMVTIRMPTIKSYEAFESFMSEKNIQVRPFFYHIKSHKHVSNINMHPEEEDNLNSDGVMLPSYPEISCREIEYITNCIDEYLTIV